MYDTRLENITGYHTAMTLAKSMLEKGIISAKDYAHIDTIIAKKYGVNSCSIYRCNA